MHDRMLPETSVEIMFRRWSGHLQNYLYGCVVKLRLSGVELPMYMDFFWIIFSLLTWHRKTQRRLVAVRTSQFILCFRSDSFMVRVISIRSSLE